MSEQGKYKYDIFISYSHRDRAWVTSELLRRLEDAGLKVCIDYRDFTLGLSSQINMEEAAKNSRHTIAVLTQKWVDSDWSQFEALITTGTDPIGRLQRLIPLLREDCTIPDRIKFRSYADFRAPDEQVWQYLLGQVRPQANAAAQTSAPQSVTLPAQNPFYQRIQEKLKAGNHCSVVGHMAVANRLY
jgi:hypothetical protein